MATNGNITGMAAELEDYRRTRDWTFLELAEEMARITGRRRDEDCWRRIVRGLTTEPHDRTRDILTTFLEAVRPAAKRGRRVRRAA